MLATQNPIELEGTYPLPEAQLDRFMFNVVMTYLSEDDEVRVVTQTTGADAAAARRACSTAPTSSRFQELVRQVVIADEVARYTVRLVDASRPGRRRVPDFVEKWVKWGAGLRASQALVLRRQGARADARPLSRVDQGHPGAREADPPAPHHARTSTPRPSASPPTRSSIGCIETVPLPASGM